MLLEILEFMFSSPFHIIVFLLIFGSIGEFILELARIVKNSNKDNSNKDTNIYEKEEC